jgi:ATP-binding cassette subfamily B protein
MEQTKQSSSTQTHRGSHGPGSRMAAGEKAKDFKGTIRRLIHYLGSYRVGFLEIEITPFSLTGPKPR